MKKIGSKITFVALGILSFLGIQPSTATTIPHPVAKQIDEVKPTTPLYLQLGIDRIPNLSADKDITLAQHWQHWSHRDHRSHWAHYAHRAHYSHYDRYR
jgi:hypothetical protein